VKILEEVTVKKITYIAVICCFLLVICTNSYGTLIRYNLTALGGSQFEYEYTVTNDSLIIPIEEFTIWFDVHLYDNLVITTEEPLASQWDEIILKKTGFELPMGYDAKSLTGGIQPLQVVSGFSVKFDWFGTGIPGSQYYEIVNPSTFVTIDSGYTVLVPEPATLLLLGFGTLAFRTKRRL